MSGFDFFPYKNDKLFCEEVPLQAIAETHGTPVYVYSHSFLVEQVKKFDQAFSTKHLICFSMKANSNSAILKTFVNLGCGIDVVTGGELERALRVNCDPAKIVFSGVGKTKSEIQRALQVGILQFNVESEEELSQIEGCAKESGKKAPVALRVNPDVDPKTHAYIATGMKKSKFGISHKKVVSIYQRIVDSPFLQGVGIDCHIGSQLTELNPFVEAACKVADLVGELDKKGISIRNVDLGGGLGIRYKDENPPEVTEYAKALEAVFGNRYCLIFEPGRFLVGNSAGLVTSVIYNKEGETKSFVVVDAASNDLMRPSLYGAYHAVLPVVRNSIRGEAVVDVVGPICETGDFLATGISLQKMKSGELLTLMSAGAYGYSMSSNYNSRPRVPEVLVKGKEHFLIRERESLEDLMRGEKIPDFLHVGEGNYSEQET